MTNLTPLENDVHEFIGNQSSAQTEYYARKFKQRQSSSSTTKQVMQWHWGAALGGPLWGASRGLWGWFWLIFLLELCLVIQIGQGIVGSANSATQQRLEKLQVQIDNLNTKSAQSNLTERQITSFKKRLERLHNVTQTLSNKLQQEQATERRFVLAALAAWFFLRVLQGFYAHRYFETRYRQWLSHTPRGPTAAKSWSKLLLGLCTIGVITPIVLASYVQPYFLHQLLQPLILEMPFDKTRFFTPTAHWIDQALDQIAVQFSGAFQSVVWSIDKLVVTTEKLLIQTPWPIIALLIVILAFTIAGRSVALMTALALTYLLMYGLWETSLITVALLGVASLLCLAIGIPFGIWFGHKPKLYNWCLPVLDFMQTMPAFVYLIPIIAFFGTGKPPGVLATLIFGMPPVIRLTALGIQEVPKQIKEAALSFGASPWRLLIDVELPLAKPSILAGINQTILMCLSMVVIASLIGAKGLGQDVLTALQYAAKGQGLLAGFAILCCALVIDRIIRGGFR